MSADSSPAPLGPTVNTSPWITRALVPEVIDGPDYKGNQEVWKTARPLMSVFAEPANDNHA